MFINSCNGAIIFIMRSSSIEITCDKKIDKDLVVIAVKKKEGGLRFSVLGSYFFTFQQ